MSDSGSDREGDSVREGNNVDLSDSDDPDFEFTAEQELAALFAAASEASSEDEDDAEDVATQEKPIWEAVSPGLGPEGDSEVANDDDDEPLSLQETHYQEMCRALKANRRLQSRLQQLLEILYSAVLTDAEKQARLQQGTYCLISLLVLETLNGAVLANAEQQARLQNSHMRLLSNKQLVPRIGRYRGMHDVVDYGSQRGVSTRTIGPSRFYVVDRQVRLAEAYRFLPHNFPTRDWAEPERDALNEALLSIVQEARFKQAFDELQARHAAGEELEIPALDAANAAVAALTLASPGVEAEIFAFGDEQWERAAQLRVPGRSGVECRAQWANRLRPGINLGPWTKEEDARLLQLAEQHKRADWLHIAVALGTRRAAVDCLARFQRQLNPELLRRPWTLEEEARLSAAVEKHGRQWAAVAAELGGRDAQQVKHHFLYAQNLNLRKGPWTKEEDEALLKAVALHGPRKWARIAPAVPHRSDQQCRERWLNKLDPSLRFDAWQPAEDTALRAAVAACTKPDGRIGWTKAALLVPGRTDNMCVRRWTTLQRWDKNGPPQPRPPKPPASKAANKRKAASAKRGDDAAAPAAPESRPANPASKQVFGGAKPAPRARKAPATKAAKRRKAASATRADAANPVSGTTALTVDPAGGAAPSSVPAGGHVGAVADAGAGPGPTPGGAAAPGRATGGGGSSAASVGADPSPNPGDSRAMAAGVQEGAGGARRGALAASGASGGAEVAGAAARQTP